MNRIFNFNSGPAMLPVDVLKQAQSELLNWHNLGTSIMEISHRSKEFIQLIEEAENDLRELLNIPSNYRVLFCHGGGRGQFAAIPLNLLSNKKKADYVNSGYWSSSAIQEAKKYCVPNVIDVTLMINNKIAVKPMKEWSINNNSDYLHYCPNETISGVAIYESPNFNDKVIVTADLSSTILSTPIDIKKYGVIYAGAQKNIGPAGLALVIIRKDLLGKSSKLCPSILDYTIINNNRLIFNTPPTFACYLAGMVFKWLKKQGGVIAINSLNIKKANLLYNVIDKSNLYYNKVFKENRSMMNVTFQLKNNQLENKFFEESFSAGLFSLKGHRSVGGIRASIYNSMPLDGVKALTDFMIDFEHRYN